MTPAALERVFGTSRLKMVTGQYAEVYREAAAPGERRRYTKRFLATDKGDFREWTEREWRTLARLVGHGARHVPDVVQYDSGAAGGPALVQTYDAGVTVDHWATLLPVQRDGRVQRHVFQDCAHWWALARALLLALHEIHPLGLVHLDLKADNICIPLAPADFDPAAPDQRFHPAFEHLALIDFAFSVVSAEALTSPLPIGWQRKYRYQSPRLLQALTAGQQGDLEPTRQLDWRCDMYSFAALLEALLPSPQELGGLARSHGWTDELHGRAKALLHAVRESHDNDIGRRLPHLELAATCAAQLESVELARSLQRGWTLAGSFGDDVAAGDGMATTAPLTRIEPHRAFTAVTEVLPQPRSAGTDRWVEALFGADPVTQPLDRDVAADAREPLPGAVRHAPAADAAAPAVPQPARDAVPQPARDAVPQPARDAARPPPPVPPAATVPRRDARPRRPTVVYLLPVLALLAAAAGWLAYDRRSAVEDRAATGSGSARVDVASASVQPAPEAARPSASSGERPEHASPAVAAPDPREAAGPRPGHTPDAAAAVSGERERVIAPPRPQPRQDAPAAPVQRPLAGVSPIVADAEPRVAQVLSMAEQARSAADDRRTAAAAASIGRGVFRQARLPAGAGAPARARQLNAAAHRAFYQERSVARAYELQRQAFDADPSDVEVAGNLAFYALKMDPPRAEESRALAVYGLALSTRGEGPSRSEDWGNLAVASALTGRPEDARNAMLVLLSMSRDVDRSCHSALSSVASHGQEMRMPAEALLRRVQDRVDVDRAPRCRWPPKWR